MNKYYLKDKETKPDFEFMIYSPLHHEYYTYKEQSFEQAVDKLKVLRLTKNGHQFNLYKVSKDRDNEYRLSMYMKVRANGEVTYIDSEDLEMHVYFYVNAGKWMNNGD